MSCNADARARVYAINEPNLPAPLYPAIEHRPGIERRESVPVFCDNDRRLVTLSPHTRCPELRDAETGVLLPVAWKLTSDLDRAFDVSSDGRWIAVAGGRDCALLSADGQSSLILSHENHLHLALFAPHSQSLATLGFDGIARLFPLRSLDALDVGAPTLIPQQSTYASGAISQDGHALAISANQQVVIWERRPTSPVVTQITWPGESWRPRPSFDGKLAAPGVYHEFYTRFVPKDVELKVIRLTDGLPTGPAIPLKGMLLDSCIWSDNASVAAVTVKGASGLLSAFDVSSGAAKWAPIELPAAPLSVAARPAGPAHESSQLAVLCQNGQLLIVDATRGEVVQSYAHPEGGQLEHSAHARVEYSPDGATIVAVQPGNRIIIRDAQTGELCCPLFNPVLEGGPCRSIAFSPDSRLLATAVKAGTWLKSGALRRVKRSVQACRIPAICLESGRSRSVPTVSGS